MLRNSTADSLNLPSGISSFLFKALTFLDVNGVAEGMNDDEFDDGVDGNCGEFVADVEEGTFLVGV